MKTIVTVIFAILFFTLQSPTVLADWKEDQAKADQYYEAGNYNKAFKAYLKLAKRGVSHSQDRVSTMYANGEGKKMDLTEAYAWSVLASQRGAKDMAAKRDSLFEQTSDKKAAEKKASRLMNKYSREALQKRAEAKAQLKHNAKSGGCTGSSLGCR